MSVAKVSAAGKAFQDHKLVTVQVASRAEKRQAKAGDFAVLTAQPLGTLAAFLLEPQSEDGLCAWNYFDAGLKEGADYPVLRVPASVTLKTRAAPQ